MRSNTRSVLVPGAQFYCGDVTGSEFHRNFVDPFDAVVLIEVIEHIPPAECVKALENAVRFLRVGGTLVVTTPSINQVNTNPQHYRHFDEPMLRTLIEAVSGMKIVAMEGYGDAAFERNYHRLMRLFDNRLFRIKPFKTWLDELYRRKHSAARIRAGAAD